MQTVPIETDSLEKDTDLESAALYIKAPLYQPSSEGGELSWGIKRTSPLLVSFSFAGNSVNSHASSLGNRVQKYTTPSLAEFEVYFLG